MKYRAEVICDACGLHYTTIKRPTPVPVRCKQCQSSKIRVIKYWEVIPPTATDAPNDVSDLKHKTTKELKRLLGSGIKGDEWKAVLIELMTRPKPPKRPVGRPPNQPFKRRARTYHHKCRHCGEEWDGLKEHPLICALCKRYNWDNNQKDTNIIDDKSIKG